MRQSDVLLVGVDGGASEVKVHAVHCENIEAGGSFQLRPEHASRKYERHSGFEPTPIAAQLAQRYAGLPGLTDPERKQAGLWIDACVEAIAAVVADCQCQRVLIGVGMPGLKTTDGRGIQVINHGPRIPDYLDRLEAGLSDRGIELEAPIAALGSDADYCGLGEQYAADGLFGTVDDAYYVGGGTGLADAMKLKGQLIPFDQASDWIQKSWQMQSALGPTFEGLISAQAINAMYAGLRPSRSSAADQAVYPELAAAQGDVLARSCLYIAATVLAELIFERIDTVKNGRANLRHRGKGYQDLSAEHAYRGTILDRVVVGQRLGLIYGQPRFSSVLAELVERNLAALIVDSNDEELTDRWVSEGGLRPGMVQASRLRAAPALGAAVAAARAYIDTTRQTTPIEPNPTK